MKLDTYLSLCTEVYDLNKPYAFYRDYVMKADNPILAPLLHFVCVTNVWLHLLIVQLLHSDCRQSIYCRLALIRYPRIKYGIFYSYSILRTVLSLGNDGSSHVIKLSSVMMDDFPA